MPCIQLRLDTVGPLTEVGISAPLSTWKDSHKPPHIVWVKALADTGCSDTSIHSSVAQAAGLHVLSKDYAMNTSGVVEINVYHGDLILRPMKDGRSLGEHRFPDFRFAELLHPNPSFDALLGMDLLNEGLFVVQGGIKNATFCW